MCVHIHLSRFDYRVARNEYVVSFIVLVAAHGALNLVNDVVIKVSPAMRGGQGVEEKGEVNVPNLVIGSLAGSLAYNSCC